MPNIVTKKNTNSIMKFSIVLHIARCSVTLKHLLSFLTHRKEREVI